MERIYMDYGASTPVDKEVIKEMMPYFDKFYGNPSSIHSFGREAFDAVEESRKKVADIICANEDEMVFTSGCLPRVGLNQTILRLKELPFVIRKKEEAREQI